MCRMFSLPHSTWERRSLFIYLLSLLSCLISNPLRVFPLSCTGDDSSSHSQSPHSTQRPRCQYPVWVLLPGAPGDCRRSGGSTQWLTLIPLSGWLKQDSPWEASQGYRERLVFKNQKRKEAVYVFAAVVCLSVENVYCSGIGYFVLVSLSSILPGTDLELEGQPGPDSQRCALWRRIIFWNNHTTNFTSACLVFYFENSLWKRCIFIHVCRCLCVQVMWRLLELSLQPCALKSSQAFMFQLPFLC